MNVSVDVELWTFFHFGGWVYGCSYVHGSLLHTLDWDDTGQSGLGKLETSDMSPSYLIGLVEASGNGTRREQGLNGETRVGGRQGSRQSFGSSGNREGGEGKLSAFTQLPARTSQFPWPSSSLKVDAAVEGAIVRCKDATKGTTREPYFSDQFGLRSLLTYENRPAAVGAV
ncbi:hypothetical protein BDZ45DRAFT_685478 [Acephala macrosclerotiorum]|nr:hypothetical protein BDZ45DRAFT_685478 [Acephala macrosclerotiorum]